MKILLTGLLIFGSLSSYANFCFNDAIEYGYTAQYASKVCRGNISFICYKDARLNHDNLYTPKFAAQVCRDLNDEDCYIYMRRNGYTSKGASKHCR